MNETTIPDIRKEDNYKPWLILIAVLLLLVLAVNCYQIYLTTVEQQAQTERMAAYEERAQSASELSVTIDRGLSRLMSDYENVAYGASVDRIAEQQLYAAEYTIQALQMVGRQNSQIISLLSAMP